MASDTLNNVTEQQRSAISDYIIGSEPINNYLRGNKNSPYYPTPKLIPKMKQQAVDISNGIRNNPLPEQISAYKGITDSYLALLFQQLGLKKAVNKDGSINHKWLNKNQKQMRKALVGSTFHDKAYTSTSTERGFAQFWSRHKAQTEVMNRFVENGQDDEAIKIQKLATEHPELIPGAHMVTMNLPKGANASFVDRMSDKEKKVDQREILVDKGSMFKISDVRKMKDSHSYELVMDMLAEEEGVKKGKKKKKK